MKIYVVLSPVNFDSDLPNQTLRTLWDIYTQWQKEMGKG